MELRTIEQEELKGIIAENSPRLGWGYFYPKEAKGAVGARLIYERGYLSTVPGRTAFSDINPVIDAEVSEYTGKVKIISVLEEFLGVKHISTSGQDQIYGEDGEYRLLASPSGSYGYVYLSVWKI